VDGGITQSEAELAKQFLNTRKIAIREIINANHQRFTSIKHWTIL
jgi:hypothetical protein